MTYPAYIREKARQLRGEKQLTIDELADRLAISRTTIYYWVRDMPIPTSGSGGGWPESARRKGNAAMQAKYRRIREQAYELGFWEFPRLAADPTFRDFVCLYIAEGHKRDRNSLSVANSDLAVLKVSRLWIQRFSRKRISYSVQYHADQNLREVCKYWAAGLEIDPGEIRLQRKSNSNGLAGRNWRSAHGVLTVSVGDTEMRARLQGWIDCLRGQWLDSP